MPPCRMRQPGRSPVPEAFPLPPLEPTRDPRVTLPDLIEVLLNKGVVSSIST